MTSRSFRGSIALSLLPAVILFAVFFVFPIATLVATAFFEWNAAGLSFAGGGNFRRLAADRAFWSALRNTAVWLAAAALVHVPLAVLVAIILSRKMPGWKIFRTLFFIPNMISYASLAIVFTSFYNPRYGLLNVFLDEVGLGGLRADWLFQTETALAAIIVTWLFHIGLYMIIVMAEIVAIPRTLYESAEIDGATRTQQDLFITLPLLRSIVGTCMILAVTTSLIYFAGVFLMTEGGPANATLNMPMLAYRNYTLFNWGYTNTIGLVILLLGLVLMLTIRAVFRVGERDFA